MKNINKDSERRGSPRVRVDFILTYKVDKSTEAQIWIGDKEANALMLDLSNNGVAILTDYDVPVSTSLLIKFTLINLYANTDERISTIEVTGEVKSNILSKDNEHRLGIIFTNIAKQERHAISTFVEMTMNK